MQKFRDVRAMGHTFGRCCFEVKTKLKRIGKKKMQVSGLLFLLSILEACASTLRLLGMVGNILKTEKKKRRVLVFRVRNLYLF